MYKPQHPFEDIESAHEYLTLLFETICDSQQLAAVELATASADQIPQRERALQLIAYNLEKLHNHIKISRRILNDLRTLTRLLANQPSKRQILDSDAVAVYETKPQAR